MTAHQPSLDLVEPEFTEAQLRAAHEHLKIRRPFEDWMNTLWGSGAPSLRCARHGPAGGEETLMEAATFRPQDLVQLQSIEDSPAPAPRRVRVRGHRPVTDRDRDRARERYRNMNPEQRTAYNERCSEVRRQRTARNRQSTGSTE